MGLEVIAGASLLTTVGSSIAQYREGKEIAKNQERASRVQARITATENRRETIRQAARARILSQRAIAQQEALGGSASDSGTQGAVGGLASTVQGQIGRENQALRTGRQLSRYAENIADAQSASALAGAVGDVAGTVFAATGGSLFDGKSAAPSPLPKKGI